MQKLKDNKWLSFAGRLIVGIVFIYAAYGKIVEPQQFAKEIANYNLMFECSYITISFCASTVLT